MYTYIIIYVYMCVYMCIYIYTLYKIKNIQPSIRSHGLGNNKTQIPSHYLVHRKLFAWKAKLPGSDPS